MYKKCPAGRPLKEPRIPAVTQVRYTDAGPLLALLLHSWKVICKMQSISLGNSLRVIYYYLTIPTRYKKSKLQVRTLESRVWRAAFLHSQAWCIAPEPDHRAETQDGQSPSYPR